MESSNNFSAVLVVGATGFLGSEICRQLREKDYKVKAMVRPTSDPGKVKRLMDLGVEITEGDVKNRASLDKASRGVSSVISTVSSILSRQEGDDFNSVDDGGQRNLIDAAKSAGVNKFVYISFCGMPGKFPLQTAKRRAENHLKNSGLNYTILQPTCFMESWLSPALGMDYINSKARIFGNGKAKLSWIALKDVAAFAVASLNNEKANNKILELGGPDALSPLEVVKIFEEKNGQKFELEFVTVPNLKTQKQQARDSLNQSIAALMLAVASGSAINSKDMYRDFAVRPTSVREYAMATGPVLMGS